VRYGTVDSDIDILMMRDQPKVNTIRRKKRKGPTLSPPPPPFPHPTQFPHPSTELLEDEGQEMMEIPRAPPLSWQEIIDQI
jgi:hypothetical protein